MSKWHKVGKYSIDIDQIEKEVTFHVCNDDDGSIYLTLSFEQIKEIALRIEKQK